MMIQCVEYFGLSDYNDSMIIMFNSQSNKWKINLDEKFGCRLVKNEKQQIVKFQTNRACQYMTITDDNTVKCYKSLLHILMLMGLD